MDKYTVDLDKVLNDFEYSELTEQNNGFSHTQPHLHQKPYHDNSQYEQPVHQKPHLTTKHSINNVFHSLNEYLNTDIKTDIANAGPSLSQINQIETTLPTIKKNENCDVASIQDIFKSITKEDNLTITNNLRENIVDKNVNSNLEENILENNTLEPEIKFVNNNGESKNLNTELVSIDLVEETKNLIGAEDIPQENLVKNTEEIKNKLEENTIVKVTEDKIEITIIQPTVKFGELELSDTELENELEELEQEYQEKLDNKEEEKQKDLKSELEEISNKITVIVDNEETDVNKTMEYMNSVPILETVEHDKLAPQTIEHHQDIKTSECDNEQETIECDKQCVNSEESVEKNEKGPEKSEENDNKANEELKIEEEEQLKIERRGSIRPSSLDLNSETTSENLTINLIGAPGSTPYNNLYSSLPVTSTPTPSSTPTTLSLEPRPLSIAPSNNNVPSSIAPPTTTPLTVSTSSTILSPPTSTITPPTTTITPPTTTITSPTTTIAPPTTTIAPPTPPILPTTDVVDVSATSLSPTPTLSDASTYSNENDNSQSDSANTSDSCNDTSLEEHESAVRGETRREDNAHGEGNVTNERGDDQVSWLGKAAPFWTPDSDALCCLHCNQKFTVIKRRHHCRACGLVLCSKCCNMKCKLQYMDNTEARVCLKCHDILTKGGVGGGVLEAAGDTGGGARPGHPMDYCSTVPPHQQVAADAPPPPPVLVPVGVLKRQGSGKSRSSKSVMFCDGIRPGCDLTELDRDFNYKDTAALANNNVTSPSATGSTSKKQQTGNSVGRVNRNLPKTDPATGSYIPKEADQLPPVVTVVKSDSLYAECSNNNTVVEMLQNEAMTFAIQRNFHVQLKIINMDCCINKQAWCFSTEGMIAVGQDEIVILLEFIDNEKVVPKDVFLHLNNIYNEAVKGTSIPEMGISIHPTANFLESKNHAGFLYIKPTFQCIQNVLTPKEPYLIGILIHRWETPWAKIFPLRLLLRLGAEYRYYPSPIISTRHRESVYVEIGHTIINLLADFRNFSYTLPGILGLTIHMSDKHTVVRVPRNRYAALMKAVDNSSEHILALGGAFSCSADSHLVCIQDTRGNAENSYTTHAINIHNKPRRVTGASFIVLNGALKSSSGLTAKSSIVEDGLMIQIPAEQMLQLRTALRLMRDFRIACGPVNQDSDESVTIQWVDNDHNFNIGVTSPIDSMALSGIPSIRVHNGRDFVCNSGNKMIRWTEVFIIQSGEEGGGATAGAAEPVDVSRVSEAISKATSQALVKYLDLLATNSQTKIAIRSHLNIENVSYLAGSNGAKLPPIYMKSLDNELIPVLHRLSAAFSENVTVSLELMFHILNC